MDITARVDGESRRGESKVAQVSLSSTLERHFTVQSHESGLTDLDPAVAWWGLIPNSL
jgi:hypothetical protein